MSPRKNVVGPAGLGSAGLGSGTVGSDHSAARPVDPTPSPLERTEEAGLRPRSLTDFVGQEELREQLSVVLRAARARSRPVDHILFAGPPGLGKTTLAGVVAAEMGVGIRVTSGPALVRAGDLAAVLADLEPGDVLFVDEVHRLPKAVEEVLYPAMEDFRLDVVLGKGPAARTIRLELPPFTLVAATTRTGLLGGPLRDRFGLVARLELYGSDDLVRIVTRSAGVLDVEIRPDGAAEIAGRSRGTPRIANRLLRRVRDYAEVEGHTVLDRPIARAGLNLFGVDEIGLDQLDRQLLDVLCRRFRGQPVGLSTLSVSLGEEVDTVEDACEPFLLRAGLIQRTPRGRVATPAAYQHLGLPVPEIASSAPMLPIE